jgi:hypothetical protein
MDKDSTSTLELTPVPETLWAQNVTNEQLRTQLAALDSVLGGVATPQDLDVVREVRSALRNLLAAKLLDTDEVYQAQLAQCMDDYANGVRPHDPVTREWLEDLFGL